MGTPAMAPDRVDDELRVSTLELFFDLVFVFTLTQLTGLLVHEPTAEGALRVVLIFVVLFWMYGGYVWLTNQVPPDRPARRLLVMLGMGAFFVCALAVPEAFGEGGVAFGLGYLLVILVHSGLWLQVYGAGVTMRFGTFNVASALCVIAAGLLDPPAAYALWVAAIAIQFVTPRMAGRAAPRFPIRPAHFVERHGLLLIVALGESVVAIGIGISGVSLDAGVFGAAVLGLTLAAALWWTYFVADEEGAERAIAAAAGVERSIGGATDRLDLGSAVFLAVGVAMFLLGDVSFRRVMGIRPVGARALAAVAAAATVALGIAVAGLAQLVGLVVIVVAALAAEARGARARWSRGSSGRAR